MRRLRRNEAAKWLVNWLNTSQEKKGDKTRIIGLIQKLQELQTFLDNHRRPHTINMLANQDFYRLETELWKRGCRYKVSPVFNVGPSLRYSGLLEIQMGRSWDSRSGGTRNELQALWRLEELARDGLIRRLMLCVECRERWLFSTKKVHCHCSRKCRQQPYENSAARKEQRRKYMREYYRKFLAADPKGRRKRTS